MGFFLPQDKFPEEVRPYLLPHNDTKSMLSDIRSHTHSKTPASFPGLVEFFLQLLLPLRCLVYFRNLGNTVPLLLALFSALFLVLFLKAPAPFGFHPLQTLMIHTFRPLLLLEDFFRSSVLHGIEVVEGLFRCPVIPCALVK